eukprot:70428_1
MLRKFSSSISKSKNPVQVIHDNSNTKRRQSQQKNKTKNKQKKTNHEDSKDNKPNKELKEDNDLLDYVKVDNNDLYHEKQQWEMCLLHSLNALYQEPKFSVKTLDNICQRLAPDKLINPHKSIFQTGNYDANVLMMALEEQGLDVQWFDSRKAPSDLQLIDSFLCPKDKYCEFKGFILNLPQKKMIIFNRRHWLTIKRIDNVWYNFDSRKEQPEEYKTDKEIQQLNNWLVDACVNNDAQLMICRVKK